MKTPVVIGVVVALHCVAVGTLLMTQGCGTTKGGSSGSGPVAFQNQPAQLPKPQPKEVMPDHVANPTKPFVKVEDEEQPEESMKVEKATTPEKAEKAKKEKADAGDTKSYTIKKGDSLGAISHRFKVSMNEIKELNPTIKDISKIRVGQEIKLPAYVDLKAPAPKPRHVAKPKPVVKPAETAKTEAAGVAPAPTAAGGEYVVQAGDSPAKIAKKCGVKEAELMKANKITNPKKLKIGQKLVLPGAAAAPTSPLGPVEPSPIAPLAPAGTAVPGVAPVTPVAPGGIVEPVGELKPIGPAPVAPAGVKPMAPAPAGVAPALKNAAMQKHLVAPGETLKDIAMMYTVTVADIMKANGMTSETVAPGQSINIPPAQ